MLDREERMKHYFGDMIPDERIELALQMDEDREHPDEVSNVIDPMDNLGELIAECREQVEEWHKEYNEDSYLFE